MSLKYFAYIYLLPGSNSLPDITESSSKFCRFKAIGLSLAHKDTVLEISEKLVDEGVQLIELCGGFGPIWGSKGSDRVQGEVPIGMVMYGPESRQTLLDLTKDF